MFSNFDDDARDVARRAASEANKRQRFFLQNEHLLLALMTADDAVVSRALSAYGLTRENVEPQIDELSQMLKGERAAVGAPTHSRGYRRVLEIAVREAAMLQHETVTPAHLLLGLIGFAEEFYRFIEGSTNTTTTDVFIQLLQLHRIAPGDLRMTVQQLMEDALVEG